MHNSISSVILKMTRLKDYFDDFLNKTSVHGFQYLSFNFNLCEKLFWFIFILLGFLGAGFMVHQTLEDSYKNPIQTTVDTVSITEYPFPAITVDSGTVCVD